MAAGQIFISRTATDKKHINTLVQPVCRIRLFCRFMTPLGKAPYRVTMGEKKWTGEADDGGWIELRSWAGNEKCFLEWSHPKEKVKPAPAEAAAGPSVEQLLAIYGAGDVNAKVAEEIVYDYETELYLDLKEGDEQEEALRRMHNLGYAPGDALGEKVKAFQRIYGRSQTGSLADVLDELLDHHDGCRPKKWPSGRDALWSRYA